MNITASAFAAVQSCLSCTTMHDVMFQPGSEAVGFARQVGTATNSALVTPPWDGPSPRVPYSHLTVPVLGWEISKHCLFLCLCHLKTFSVSQQPTGPEKLGYADWTLFR